MLVGEMKISRRILAGGAGSFAFLLACGLAIAAPEETVSPNSRAASSTWKDVPLSSSNRWQALHYKNIPANQFGFSKDGMTISVNNSASPLILPLEKPLFVTRLRAKGQLKGKLNVDSSRQGEKGYDDYVLRIGLVVPGEKRLNFIQRRTAPNWVQTLFKLAPEGTGISKVQFFNVAASPDQIGKTRQHPLSNLLYETVVAAPAPGGHLEFNINLNPPTEVLALWISSDGDDTQSHYSVQLQRLELEVK